MFHVRRIAPLALAALVAAACSKKHDDVCNPTAQTGCGSGQVCENVDGGSPACFDPVSIRGVVYDLTAAAPARDNGGISGARVVALDASNVPEGGAVATGTGGSYRIDVRAARAADGSPVSRKVTLRADAAGFQTFPGGVRSAVPIALDATTAVHKDGAWIVQSVLTDVGLFPLGDSTRNARIHGKVVAPAGTGVLVVAETLDATTQVKTGFSGIADSSGAYVIYNLAPAAYDLRAYAIGVNQETKSVTLAANQDAEVNLGKTGDATATVSGALNLVSGASGATSVVLAVKSTFDDQAGTGLPLGRADAVPGLRLPIPAGAPAFQFVNVPDGDYVVLAAFENDGLVRQVSGQGGTQPQFVTVAGAPVALSANPKIVPAINLLGPGADPLALGPEAVQGTVHFRWEPYSSVSLYEIELFDALGRKIWSQPDPIFDPTTGAFDEVAAYGAKQCSSSECDLDLPTTVALQAGMIYQVRITGWGINSSVMVPYSRTEDLLGVFAWQP